MSNVAKRLLESQVFGFILKAKIRFPELFDVSPAQSAERDASEAKAARDEANTVKWISEKETAAELAVKSSVDGLEESNGRRKGMQIS